MRSSLPQRCFACSRIAVGNTGRCEVHGGVWVKSAEQTAKYHSAQYQMNRETAIREEPRCHWRLPGCTGRSTQADHVVSVAKGGTHERSNLVGSCKNCNEARGRHEGRVTKAERRRGVTRTRTPEVSPERERTTGTGDV